MLDWLSHALRASDAPPWDTAAARVGLSVVAGFFVAGVYAAGLGRRKDEPWTLPTTLVLLTIIIAIVTQVIGENLARAFGLVGALSIVRFRTVVEDTRDTAFVIFAVVIGMAIGAGYPLLAASGIPAVLLAALVMRLVGPEAVNGSAAATLTIRLGLGHDPDGRFTNIFTQHLSECRLIGTSTAKQGAVLELTYRVRLRTPGGTFALVSELNRVEGVQGVELRS
jgi:Domain of unknown function (DUF4956)